MLYLSTCRKYTWTKHYYYSQSFKYMNYYSMLIPSNSPKYKNQQIVSFSLSSVIPFDYQYIKCDSSDR